ncbi:MAG TPA: nuclease-related domain-containing protein [Solirubrobacterales bacterium]|nr:nuclease-related domain-containing protein [Solirubrobacterales bacterium]
MSAGTETRRQAGQHARAQAKRLGWLRFLGGSFKRDFGAWSQGAEGEEVVGKILEGLAADGWHVIHDVSFGRANIDHIVVGPGGIFTVETKSHRGKIFLDNVDQRMLGQAYAEKRKLEEITGMEVQALLVFSQAYLVGRVPAKRRGVLIVPARMLADFFAGRRPVMSVEEAAVIYSRLALAVGQTPSLSQAPV